MKKLLIGFLYWGSVLAAEPTADTKPDIKVPDIKTVAPQAGDAARNGQSDVFGANLFTGAFARQGASPFNADYALAVGDKVQVRFWGTFNFESVVSVDAQGNVFLPHVGPVQVLGVKNQDLQKVIEAAMAKVFRNSVSSYAQLAEAQPVRIFVSGFVNRPGLFNGTSMDSLLHYLDQAGGIDADRGSYLSVQVKRGDTIRAQVSLYDFLLLGKMPIVQLSDGDVVFVPPKQSQVKVSGLAVNTKRFEFSAKQAKVSDVLALAKPLASATHVRVVRNTGTLKNTEYYPLGQADTVMVQSGDELEFTADKKLGTITVRLEGEHLSAQEYVLPYGSRLKDLMSQVAFSSRSDSDGLQLFRISVKERQRQMLQTSLKSLETAALTARSGTSDEARLRKDEAELLLQWIDKAKSIEPRGQVVLGQSVDRNELLLENGDILKVPLKDNLVLISGEVLFPNALAFDRKLGLDDYVQKAGGYTQNADTARIVVAHRDGSFTQNEVDTGFFGKGTSKVKVNPGDEVLVLPKIDVKSRQIFKDMTQIIYQIAVSAKVVLGL
jgi:protein involved in polysaccharide export with SLBB domain